MAMTSASALIAQARARMVESACADRRLSPRSRDECVFRLRALDAKSAKLISSGLEAVIHAVGLCHVCRRVSKICCAEMPDAGWLRWGLKRVRFDCT